MSRRKLMIVVGMVVAGFLAATTYEVIMPKQSAVAFHVTLYSDGRVWLEPEEAARPDTALVRRAREAVRRNGFPAYDLWKGYSPPPPDKVAVGKILVSPKGMARRWRCIPLGSLETRPLAEQDLHQQDW
jgi:hypothetical protein